jgi:transposase
MECQAKHGGEAMAFTLVADALWNEIEPLLPVEPSKPDGGRPRVANRACLTGIVFVLRSGLPWRMLPTEMGCGSGVTCWRRLRDWTAAGVWPEIHAKLLNILGRRRRIKLSRAVIDSASVRALFGGPTPARTRRIVRKKGANGT